jgi:hypothetical protein
MAFGIKEHAGLHIPPNSTCSNRRLVKFCFLLEEARLRGWLLSLFLLLPWVCQGLEVQGFLTKDCRRLVGLIVHVDDQDVYFLQENGSVVALPQDSIETLYVYNVIESPIAQVKVDQASLPFLRTVYLDGSKETYAFPVRFIEDLVIFYSLDGKNRVLTFKDIYKLRPAPETLAGLHAAAASKQMSFAFTYPSARCGANETQNSVKPTRILSDQIGISEFLQSFKKGYESLESFEERTYLYARPLLYPRKTRLGLVFIGNREEPGLQAPFYFQWSTGEPYRFQSYSVIGSKAHEFTPTAEPVFSVRSDVKSHIFHGMFVGNVAGMPAGNSIFLKNMDLVKLNGPVSIEPSFNYMAMMGGDFGPYSASIGFYFPTYGIRVGNQYREVLANSVTYAFRGMYTTRHVRLRAIGAYTKHSSPNAGQDDVLSRAGTDGDLSNPTQYKFQSLFLRGGIDYEVGDRLTVGADGIIVNGTYSEMMGATSSAINFTKTTAQVYVQRTFGSYVALNGYLDIVKKNYGGTLVDQDAKTNSQDMVYFGSLEFIF